MSPLVLQCAVQCSVVQCTVCRQIVQKTSGTEISFVFLGVNVIDQEMEADGGMEDGGVRSYLHRAFYYPYI